MPRYLKGGRVGDDFEVPRRVRPELRQEAWVRQHVFQRACPEAEGESRVRRGGGGGGKVVVMDNGGGVVSGVFSVAEGFG